MANPPVEQRATADRRAAERGTDARKSSREVSVPEPALEGAAWRLGAVYSELVREGKMPLGVWALPKWLEPKRLRPLGGFGLTSQIDLALSPVYFGWLARDYPLMSQYYNRHAYESDLRVCHQRLARLLPDVVTESLRRQERELRALYKRFNSHGVKDRIHESALRIRATSGGLRPSIEDLQKIDSRRKVPLLGSAAYREQFEFHKGRNSVTRERVLRSLKAERDKLEAGNSKPLDSREEQAQGNAKEISALLVMFAVHHDTVELLDLYAESSLKGAERMNSEIQNAVEATALLRERLTKDDPDDAWAYAPFVLAAVSRLNLHDIAGLPEFSVAMGRLLAKTKTDAVMSIATMVMVGLSLAFTGPVGAVAVGVLDLALAGMDVALTTIRIYEQDIAAKTSEFSPEKLKLAEHVHGEDAALSVAGAFLSAIALAGPVKPLLRARPRGAEVLKTEVKTFDRTKLELDLRNHAGGFAVEVTDDKGHLIKSRALENRINATLGKPSLISEERMTARAEQAGTTRRVGENREYDKAKMYRQGKKGTVKEQSVPAGSVEQQRGVPEYNGSVREYDLEGLPEPLDAARQPPDLKAIYTRERVTTREQITGIFQRDSHYPRLEEQKRMLLDSHAPDPIIPEYIFSAANPPHVDHIVAENLVRKFDGFTELTIENQRKVLHMDKNLELVCQAVNDSRREMPYSLWDGTDKFKISFERRKTKIAQEKALAFEMQNMIYDLIDQQRQLRGTTRSPAFPIKAGSGLTGHVSRGLRLIDERRDE